MSRDESIHRVLAETLYRASFGKATTDDMDRVARQQVNALRRAGVLDDDPSVPNPDAGIAPCCGHGTTAHGLAGVSEGCYAKACKCRVSRQEAVGRMVTERDA